MFRIQKILLADYQEIYEPVLVESPFAEVTEGGIGIRQVQLGLTPTRIIMGQDFFEKSTSYIVTEATLVDRDPEIECFELVCILPLEVLKLFWNIWRERIATLRQTGPNLFNISTSSPFSSTDYIPEEEEVAASVHPSPRAYHSSDAESICYPLEVTRSLYSRFTPIYTDAIEIASKDNLLAEAHDQMELQNYFSSLSVTNSFSCGCNTSW